MKELDRSEQPRWLNEKPIKEINQRLRAKPERRRGWRQRVFTLGAALRRLDTR
jgi:hypothetical protein